MSEEERLEKKLAERKLKKAQEAAELQK